MKTVVVLAAIVALSLAANFPTPSQHEVETKSVDGGYVARQKAVLDLFKNVDEQFDHEEEWYRVGNEYDPEASINKYTNKEVVEDFMKLYRSGFLPKYEVFSIFDERVLEETVALFKLFYYANNFLDFYKTAAWARVHLNKNQFIYTFYIAIIQRPDTQDMVIPAPYEIYPELFTNSETIFKVFRVKVQDGLLNEKLASNDGIVKENNNYILYANYSSYRTYGPEEQRLAYFTEDVGMNSCYFYFHSYLPFWINSENHILKKRLGELWVFYYQQLLARYYLERLSNGLGEIPDFSWKKPIKTRYTPFMSTLQYPFIQRNSEYRIPVEKYNEEIQFLETFEKNFLQYMQRGMFKAYGQETNIRSPESLNFVGNYWQSNPNLYSQTEPRKLWKSYENIARHLLSAVPESFEERTVLPSALNFYQTSLRDPIFYQLYSKILKYIKLFKENIYHFSHTYLKFYGVKINDVQVDKLVTFFDFFEYEITNGVYRSNTEIKNITKRYLVRQPRLNHKPFTVTVDYWLEYRALETLIDNKPFGYPFDRPLRHETPFRVPNILFKDVLIYFEGTHFPYQMNNPFHGPPKNQVSKH
ncbi:arylphorin subunit alpha-like [Pectinophora gossypiella]|uniref:arylphorin subunit alpha-like n=1 Tax=Pectinophora gossypiella TaxID=13191 RepID=UPI00214F0683|nr:arylphorin subunit alpha-like [Pectinophora gossypiella]